MYNTRFLYFVFYSPCKLSEETLTNSIKRMKLWKHSFSTTQVQTLLLPHSGQNTPSPPLKFKHSFSPIQAKTLLLHYSSPNTPSPPLRPNHSGRKTPFSSLWYVKTLPPLPALVITLLLALVQWLLPILSSKFLYSIYVYIYIFFFLKSNDHCFIQTKSTIFQTELLNFKYSISADFPP